MCDDPNGTRWAKSDRNFGRALLQRAGWAEGRSLGVYNSGVTTHVRVQRKESVTGIGYDGVVQQAWSAQSVGFADVLTRIKSAVQVSSEWGEEPISAGEGDQGRMDSNSNSSSESDDRNNNSKSNNRSTNNGPSGGRHVCMYAKRHALKTELLRVTSDAASAEILGSASSSHKRKRENDTESGDNNNNNNETTSTLQSPLLQRLMVRMPKHEPRRTTVDASDTVRITKPQPRPPKCTDTPFFLRE